MSGQPENPGLRAHNDRPSIGIILCAEKDNLAVEPERCSWAREQAGPLEIPRAHCHTAPCAATTAATMPSLTLRASHKAVLAYYESLAAFATLGATHETAVRTAFAALLEAAAKPFGWKLVPEHSMRGKGGKRIAPDGTLMDVFRLHHGHWEAKDSKDDLNKEIRAKIDKGYPTANLLF